MKTAEIFRVLGNGPAALVVPFTLIAHANRNRAQASPAPAKQEQRRLAALPGARDAFTKA